MIFLYLYQHINTHYDTKNNFNIKNRHDGNLVNLLTNHNPLNQIPPVLYGFLV